MSRLKGKARRRRKGKVRRRRMEGARRRHKGGARRRQCISLVAVKKRRRFHLDTFIGIDRRRG